eukprot:GHVP01041949.1.p1 GENE.GHVP01041949.1~~GHVP01041949.1.p1  ORF type:complete len:206 (-),score=40.58 GHVP01041949.1:744-1361(-)
MGKLNKNVVIDGKGHLMGRLAATCAKCLLKGYKIDVVRCEEINISGKFARRRWMMQQFLNKASISNPTHYSHIHYRTPHRIFWRVVRGMLPHKMPRGATALSRLNTFEGVPKHLEMKKKKVVPLALRCVRLKEGRRYSDLNALAKSIGWGKSDIIKKAEEERKARMLPLHEKRVAHQKKVAHAKQEANKLLTEEEKALLASVAML